MAQRCGRLVFLSVCAAALLAVGDPLLARPAGDALHVHWNEGAQDCKASTQPALQTYAYDARTYILRQNPCVDFEANFLYLLIGTDKALLIDTGAVADPHKMPLADTVMQLLSQSGAKALPLLVVHTHKHLDHRGGDPQFAGLPAVQVVNADLDSVREFFGFSQWPQGVAHIDLGGRVVDVMPAPGHQSSHVVFYDHATALVFTGDFLMPGRLLIDDKKAFRKSAARLAEFFSGRPVSHILGGHIELDAQGSAYPFGSHYHPNEHALELSKDDLVRLDEAADHFRGHFYKQYPDFILFSTTLDLVLAWELWGPGS
jgi:hydroxyacylglutathione hydrolase